MPISKPKLWLATLALGAIFVASGIFMAERIKRYNIDAKFAHYHAEQLGSRDIRLVGFPHVTIEDQPAAAGAQANPPIALAPGESLLKLTYGNDEANRIVKFAPVQQPPALNLPTLGIYAEWACLLAINQVDRDAKGEARATPGSERLMLVVRRTPHGYDAATWGSVRRTEWLFDFYDFIPDGSIKLQTRRWPMAQARHEAALQERAKAAPDDAAGRHIKEIAAIAPLEERTPEYLAAMHVIPKLNVPKHKFTDTAFTPRVLGWTLPVSMLSGLAFCITIFFAIAPAKVAPRSGEHRDHGEGAEATESELS